MPPSAPRPETPRRDGLVMVTHCHRPIAGDLPLMRAGGVTAKVYQVTLDVDVEAGIAASRDREEGWLRLATEGMDQALRDIEAHAHACVLARTAADVLKARARGQVAILLGAEGARWLEGSLSPLRLFHRLGLRELQLTWAFANPLVPDGHLSAFGRDVVRECADLGIVVDVTHIPEAAFYEVIEAARQPIIVSHGAAAGVTCDLDDARLEALAGTRGLLGIHFYTSYLGPAPAPEDVVRQVEYIAGRVGIDHVALGVDFFPTQGAWRRLQEDQGTRDLRWAVPDMSHMPRIAAALDASGLSAADVDKVLGLNVLRLCQEVFGS